MHEPTPPTSGARAPWRAAAESDEVAAFAEDWCGMAHTAFAAKAVTALRPPNLLKRPFIQGFSQSPLP